VRLAHFDCFSGISGDMTLGALIDAGVPESTIRTALDSLGLPITMEVERVKRCGQAAVKVTIAAPDQEDYRFLPDIEAIVAKGSLTARQRELTMSIFRKLAEAEAKCHDLPLERIHFHEVGALDSIADIVGVAVGLDTLNVQEISCRSVAVGSGTVKCAHGVMPVPAPATAELLRGFSIAAAPVKGELTTPTGAAILAATVTCFRETPVMTVERIGCGAGTKDPLEQPNILRVFVGTQGSADLLESDTVVVLETNLDDTTPEIVGYCIEELLRAGALDAFAIPIQMKKQRPGLLLSAIADASQVAKLEAILFRETGTFGIRKTTAVRSKLLRESVVVETPWGPVRAKRGWRSDGFAILTPEYEDCARVARERQLPLREVYASVRRGQPE
jgi:uncharacterized protein (TIGR00299 family) protein